MRLRTNARTLKGKALSSLRASIVAFNLLTEDGRVTATLLHLQHAFEMLLKAALNQSRKPVFDLRTGRSIGIDKSIELARMDPRLGLSEVEAGTIRAIDAMRDDEQHWFTDVSEGQLYLHVRAGVTLFDDLLRRAFDEHLADHLPHRVLPISVNPPEDFLQLVDRDFSQIATLLAPGRRARSQARAKIRGLLALEAHVEPDTHVSEADVARVEKGIRAGKPRSKVFPRLSSVAADVAGDGVTVTVRFSKTEGAPVRLVGAGGSDHLVDAAAIREVDLQRKYHWSPGDLAKKLGLTDPRSAALRRHLGIDDDSGCVHVFVFGSQRHPRYSDNALTKMREACQTLDMAAIWAGHRVGRGGPQVECSQPNCARNGQALEKAS